MSIVFASPIPGQSLTNEPRNMPFERPPEVSEPLKALDMHVKKITNANAMEDAFYFLEQGLDLATLVEGMLRSAVMSGIHSVDVSLIIAPALHEYIKGLAIESDIEFDEGFDKPKERQAIRYQRDSGRAADMLRKIENGELPMPEDDTEKPMEESMEEPMEEPVVAEAEVEEPPKGLMARI